MELHEQRLDQDTLRRCDELAMAARPDHRLVCWQGAAPAQWVTSFGRVMGHVLDAPGGGSFTIGRGRRCHGHHGGVVGRWVAEQHDTAVLPEHRGGGLARWMKARQTLRLHELFPTVESVTVTVNQQDAPMLAVNRAVGYRLVRERLLVEVSTHRLKGGPRCGPARG
ncbi:GNAT family N-acetyltransferase [Actinomadura spongiicola]|uniref:hypothetical protein n=1 Tax=Actinomadura spongiicola TaxID=2303421 RepID=UPI0011C18D96|nr:hypothetical protein [Actinomadura spongiicola]